MENHLQIEFGDWTAFLNRWLVLLFQMSPRCVLMVNTQTCWDSNLTSKYPVTSCHRSFATHFPLRISLCMNHLHWFCEPRKASSCRARRALSRIRPRTFTGWLCWPVSLHWQCYPRLWNLGSMRLILLQAERCVINCYLARWAASVRGSIIPFCCTWPCRTQPCTLSASVWHAEAYFCFKCRQDPHSD